MNVRRHLMGYILIACAVTGCANGIDQQKFDGLYRAGKAMTGATGVGVNLIRYSELLQQLVSELSIARDRAKGDSERALVNLYGEGVQAYTDAHIVWNSKLKSNGALVGMGDEQLKGIVDKYPVNGQGTGASFRFDPDAAVQTIWSRATTKINAAEGLYNGKASETDTLPQIR